MTFADNQLLQQSEQLFPGALSPVEHVLDGGTGHRQFVRPIASGKRHRPLSKNAFAHRMISSHDQVAVTRIFLDRRQRPPNAGFRTFQYLREAVDIEQQRTRDTGMRIVAACTIQNIDKA